MSTLTFRLRILAGRVYAVAFDAVRRLAQVLVPPDSALARLRRRVAERIRPTPKHKVWMIVRAFAAAYPEAVFVQVGSNDGMMHDPLQESIRRRAWRGVLVEPVPQLFARLTQNYRDRPGLAFENVAVSSQEGTLPFYHLDTAAGPELPDWAAGLGSFSRDMLLSHAHKIPNLARYVVERQVPVVRFDTICQRHGIEALDLLHIDAEGHDYEILRSVNLERFKPRLLMYESQHLSTAQQGELLAWVEKLGYTHMTQGLDTFCLRLAETTDRDRALIQTWKLIEGIEEIPA
jgi:FkbM family methyltransferase